MQKPDVSVIVATYNVQPYIERALRSALDQQGVQVEIIVIDDNSTDDTVDVASRIKDPRIKILRRPTNGGPGAARNEGLAMASAPWIAILDGDDRFAEGRLQRCLQRARAMQADIIVDNLQICREADGVTFPMFSAAKLGRSPLLDLPHFIGGNLLMFSTSSFGYFKPMFSREFLLRHHLQYDPALRIGEDYMLLLEALAWGARCVIDPTAGYLYTMRAGSISHRLALADILHMKAGDQKFLSRHKLDPAAQRAQRLRTFSIEEVFHFTRLVNALKKKQISEAVKIVLMRPTSALHLWNPIWVRLKKLMPVGSRR